MDCFVLDIKACQSVRRLGASETWYPCDFFGMLYLDLICLEHCLNHRMGWKGPYKSSSSISPATGRDPFHQIRLRRALSNLALNLARDGAATASLGNLCQRCTILRVKNFFLTSHLSLRSFSLKALPLSYHYMPL